MATVPIELFCTAWAKAQSLNEVVTTLNITRDYAVHRATWLRKKGVKLKKFRTGRPSEKLSDEMIATLNESISEIEEDADEDEEE